MTRAYDPGLVDRFLAQHWRTHPVDATFMGDQAHDHLLPPVGADVLSDEQTALAALLADVTATAEPEELGHRLDRRMLIAELQVQLRLGAERPRFDNPAWYTGEAAFGIVSLLLPQSLPVREAALIARLEAVPAFLSAAASYLSGRKASRGWTERAQREALAMAEFLTVDLVLHESYDPRWAVPAVAAAAAFHSFATSIADLPHADPVAGEELLGFLMATQHGLALTPRGAIAEAEAAFAHLGDEMEAMARAIDPNKTAAEILAALSAERPPNVEAAFASYGAIDQVARNAARGRLMTPAEGYGLDYRFMAPCFRKLSQSLYFLFYRSPPALNPGQGSVYWVTPPGADEAAFLAANTPATVKTIHSVHHGGVGHHTQNARARVAASRLARLAGTDCAMGLAFLGAITLIEGWACYVEDLMLEAPGFYSPAEALLLKYYERRNAASVLVDAKFHAGIWSLEDAMAFYRDKAGFAPSRVAGEVVRNSIFPGSRLVYWLGVEGIKALRKRWRGDTLSFHDTLLSFGHVPLAWIGEEMARAGQLNP